MTETLASSATTAFAKPEPDAGLPMKAYIDGSGSMFHTHPGASAPALYSAVSATMQKGLGGNTAFWGNETLIPMTLTSKAEIAGLVEQLFCSVALAPVAHDMAATAAGGKIKNFVVFSDGDLGDFTDSQEAFAKALKENKDATVDFIIMHPTAAQRGLQTQMHYMTDKLLESFPGQVGVTTVDPIKQDCANDALDSIIAKRQSAPAAAATPQAKAAPRP